MWPITNSYRHGPLKGKHEPHQISVQVWIANWPELPTSFHVSRQSLTRGPLLWTVALGN